MTSSINEKFILKDELEKGSYYNKYKVLNKCNNIVYALKKIPFKDKIQSNLIKDKLSSIQKLENTYLVKIFEFFPEKNNFNILMEFFNSLNLRNFINEQNNEPIKQEIILYISLNICEALKVLHNNNLVYINLKPENIFINEDFIIKIGDFGVPIQLIKNLNNNGFYSENIELKEYDYKDDIESLGYILLELCTLKKFSKKGDKLINTEYYGNELQNLINQLLNADFNARPDINLILIKIKNIILNHKINIEKRQKIFQGNEVFKKYILQKNIDNSLDNNDIGEEKLNMINLHEQIFKLGNLFYINTNEKSNEKKIFINENIDIIKVIEEYLIKFNIKKLNEKISKNKIIIFNQNNYFKSTKEVVNLLTSEKYLNDIRLKNTREINYNIILINGDERFIKRFLNSKNGERIEKLNYNKEESIIDLKIYNGKRNNKNYTFFEPKGINNIINNENKNIFIKLIDLVIKNGISDSFISCIWFCFEGLNITEIDKKKIKILLKVYDICNVPIIFVHFNKNYSEYKRNKYKEDIKKFLNELYSKDEIKVNNHLQNYINIYIPRNEDNLNFFGLDDLENISVNKIKYTLFYKKIQQILTNAIFDLLLP